MKTHSPLSGRTLAIWIGAGALLGALAMATLQNSKFGPKVLAQRAATGHAIGNIKTESLEMLRSLDDAFSSISRYALDSVVHIKSENTRTADSEGRFIGAMGGEGSGVIYRPDGYIITNDHVVHGFNKVTVTLNDGRDYPGKVIRSDDSDIAVVKIEAKDLPALKFSDSSQVRPGQFAIAVGSPFGLENSVTIGHVSAVGRPSTVPDPQVAYGVRYYPDMIQTDAAINMGNSGGPLINVDGEVVGINTAIYSRTGENVGIGFAIPANQARLISDLLIEKGKIVRGYLGVRPINLKEYQRKEMGLDGGALVGPDDNSRPSPARNAGIKEGDVIVRIGTIPIRNEMDLRNSMLRLTPSETVKIEFVRNGVHKTVDVKIVTPPVEPKAERQPQRGRLRGPNFNEWVIPDLKEFQKRYFQPGEDVSPLRSGPARLGVRVESLSPTLRKQFHVPESARGAVITVVEPGSVAEKLGLQPGDVVQELGDKAINSSQDLSDAMKTVDWGDTRRIKYVRYGQGSQSGVVRDVKF